MIEDPSVLLDIVEPIVQTSTAEGVLPDAAPDFVKDLLGGIGDGLRAIGKAVTGILPGGSS